MTDPPVCIGGARCIRLWPPACTGAAFIVQGNEATSGEYLREWAEVLGRDVTRLCGGSYRVVEPAVI